MYQLYWLFGMELPVENSRNLETRLRKRPWSTSVRLVIPFVFLLVERLPFIRRVRKN